MRLAAELARRHDGGDGGGGDDDATGDAPPGGDVRFERLGSPAARARHLAALHARSLRAHAPERLAVEVVDEGSHPSRVVVDAPRRLLRAIGVSRVPPPGSRRSPDGGEEQRYFDEEPLLDELDAAGLGVVARLGDAVLVAALDDDAATRPAGRAEPPREAASFAREVLRAFGALPRATRRLAEPPRAALRDARRDGARATRRGARGRARLRRAISWVDALGPGGPQCLRRVLLELALDAGAAEETVRLGLDPRAAGHAWIVGREPDRFGATFDVPAHDAGSPSR